MTEKCNTCDHLVFKPVKIGNFIPGYYCGLKEICIGNDHYKRKRGLKVTDERSDNKN